MSRRRHTPEQVVRKLREADRLLSEGMELPEVFKQLEIAEATYHRWRNQYGGMKADDVKRLKELEAENARLKRIVADQVLENQALKEIARGRMKVKSSPAQFSRPRLVASRQSSARRRLGRARPSCARSRVVARG
jgi:putative transposase